MPIKTPNRLDSLDCEPSSDASVLFFLVFASAIVIRGIASDVYGRNVERLRQDRGTDTQGPWNRCGCAKSLVCGASCANVVAAIRNREARRTIAGERDPTYIYLM
ncbi:hypothetical protein PLICRDRAFT_45765 [Plicaturopsis crispa FD-325 SS-3]|uniref:Uncharacterized protein n=1 Tax=Plicaturopsis crispa FD-325 SS-3 TaxID=944288 RepID=A0A0C9T6F8_PLICR|nr:hypothetical protein PLICRDRAFT_45765 [Plicaturopsis crispa FD-325 SS-3]